MSVTGKLLTAGKYIGALVVLTIISFVLTGLPTALTAITILGGAVIIDLISVGTAQALLIAVTVLSTLLGGVLVVLPSPQTSGKIEAPQTFGEVIRDSLSDRTNQTKLGGLLLTMLLLVGSIAVGAPVILTNVLIIGILGVLLTQIPVPSNP